MTEIERRERKDNLLQDGVKRWKELVPKVVNEMFCSSKPAVKEVADQLKRKKVEEWEGMCYTVLRQYLVQ